MLARNYHEFIAANTRGDRTSSYADYDLCAPHACCAWMTLHDDVDYGVTKEQPLFSIKPLYWAEDATLVITNDDDEFCIVERTSEVITFNGAKLHGLLPTKLALALVEAQTEEILAYEIFEKMAESNMFHPKMIWDWVPIAD
jgi:hypothetical protein